MKSLLEQAKDMVQALLWLHVLQIQLSVLLRGTFKDIFPSGT